MKHSNGSQLTTKAVIDCLCPDGKPRRASITGQVQKWFIPCTIQVRAGNKNYTVSGQAVLLQVAPLNSWVRWKGEGFYFIPDERGKNFHAMQTLTIAANYTASPFSPACASLLEA